MRKLVPCLAWILRVGVPVASLGLHFGIVSAYARRWDHAAALTVFPFWAWCLLGALLGLVSWLFYRQRWVLGVMALWIVTMVIGSDETKPLLRLRADLPQPGVPQNFNGEKMLRVVSLNCHYMNPICAEEVLPWHPDIVLLQEAPSPAALEGLARRLYPDGKSKHLIGGYEVAVLTRGEVQAFVATVQQMSTPTIMRELPCTILLDGKKIHVVCVHLQGAVTDVGLHRLSTWDSHYRNRLSRREEMKDVRRYLEIQKTMEGAPIVIGGDFNAPAGDAVFRELIPEFTDAFAAVGSGWGDSFPNKTPLLRIDHIYANQRLQPMRARTVQTVNSDHRMLVVDFALR